MAQASGQRSIPQTKEALLKSYQKRLKDDVKSMADNYMEIIKAAKIDMDNSEQDQRETRTSKPAQVEQDQYEMEVRAANIVRAGESLMKLVSDMKQFLILNDFPSVNESIVQTTNVYKVMQNECDQKLLSLRDDIAADLYELEDEYYSSAYK